MAQVNLGRIGFVNKGSWNIATNYKLNDVVKYGGSTYAAKRPNTGVTPPTNGTDTDDWFYFVNNSDYVDKTSNQDIIGIKNFTNGITTPEISGNPTVNDEMTFAVSPIVPTPTVNTQAANKKYVDDIISNIQALPIGAILNGYTIFPNCIVAFGGEFNRADYPKLWAYLQANPTLVKTQAQWQTEATANGGICGFFSSGNGTTTFRVPNLNKAFLRTDSRGVGSYQADELKSHNHTMTMSLKNTSSDGVSMRATSIPGETGSTGGDETRPKNIAVLPLIVAK